MLGGYCQKVSKNKCDNFKCSPEQEAAKKAIFKLTNIDQAPGGQGMFLKALLKFKASDDTDFKKYCTQLK